MQVTRDPGRVPGTRRSARAVLVSLGLALIAAAAMASTASATLSRVGPIDPDTLFPAFYNDGTGLGLQMCLDGPPNCLAARDELIDPALGGDGEAFYYSAEATAGPITVANVLEAAYAAPGAGQEAVFMRSDIDATTGGLVANTKYTITDPYGVLTCTADANGIVTRNACRTETAVVARDFTTPLGGRIGPFLTWDTFGSTAGAPPPGYIGDAATPHKVVGSAFNKLRVEGPRVNTSTTDRCPDVAGAIGDCNETDLFIIQGKVQPGVSARTTPGDLDFGNIAGPAQTKPITYASTGTQNAIVNGVTLGGTNAADFAVTQNCTQVALGIAPGSSCTINVSYTPRAGVASSATVTITDNTTGSPRTISVKGSSLPVMTVDRTSIPFLGQKVGTTSATETVVVGNEGVANLTVASATLTGTGASHFKIASNGCPSTTQVAPDSGCEIAVAFAPTSSGAKTANLRITDSSGAIKNVGLTGTGTQPTVTVTPTSVAFPDTNVGASSTPRGVTLTNGGSATFTIDAIDITGTGATQFSLGTNTCSVGTNVAPGNSCVTQVVFAPTTAGAKSATLSISADGAVSNVPLSGTGLGAAGDTTAPTLTARSPGVNGTGVAVGANVTATFSEAVNVPAGTFTLKNTVTGAAVSAQVTRNGTTNQWILNPDANLANGTQYTATLTSGITDLAGNPFGGATWTFTTVAAAADTTAPRVSARAPAVNATAASTTANVTATFSEAVQDATVNTTTFTVKNAATGVTVAAVVSRNGTTNQWILNPDANLANDTTYTVTLTGGASGIKDLAGNALVTVTWSFTTGPRPTVSARSPAVNAIGVLVGANVTATFSEAVQGVTASVLPSTAGTFALRNAATGALIDATVTRNGTTNQWILNPGANLAAGTQYTVTLTGGAAAIRDSVGNPLLTVSWSFTTA